MVCSAWRGEDEGAPLAGSEVVVSVCSAWRGEDEGAPLAGSEVVVSQRALCGEEMRELAWLGQRWWSQRALCGEEKMRKVLQEDPAQGGGCWYQVVCQEPGVTQPWVGPIRRRTVTGTWAGLGPGKRRSSATWRFRRC